MHYTLGGPLKLDGGEETKIFDLVLKMNGAQSGATHLFFWYCIVAAFVRPLISVLRIGCTFVEIKVVTVDREGLRLRRGIPRQSEAKSRKR